MRTLPAAIPPLAAIIAASPALAGGPTLATYRVTFEAVWTDQTHPTDFPPNPHFSPLIGGTHNADYTVWEPGGIATFAIERMAEAGRRQELQAQFEARIVAGEAESVFWTNGTPSPGVRTKTFSTHQSHSLVSLVTMLAPSPDWFVGVHSVPLFQDGQWVELLSFELLPYDSGTDAGATYTSPNDDITPHIPIVEIGDEYPFNSGGPVAYMTFELLGVSQSGCSPADLAPPYAQLDFNDVIAFLVAFAAAAPPADVGPPFGTFDFTDVTTFLAFFDGGCP